jgi:short-subunit dehydrogenase
MKTVLVTGSTSGFGFGLVQALLANGCKVIATGRNLSQRREVFSRERERYQGQLIEMDLDITNKKEVDAVTEALKNTTLDVLVNNAGYGLFGPAEECTEEKLRDQFEVNFFGPVLLTQKLLPLLRASQGHIINFSSVFGTIGFPLTSSYCASKFAIEGYSEALALELRAFGVQVTLIQPGGFRTKFNDNIQWGMAEKKPQSVYHRQIENYEQLRAKIAQRTNPPNPQIVIDGVTEIILKRKKSLNYSFGTDATFTRLLKKILPRSLYHKTTGRVLDRIFLKELL